ncbi:alkaline phosphatase D family protein [Streptomyces ficellus]|uniref:Alkaline phosphatase D family protein n=1 Tax=Streptomyces ficellus TaxID=1977088 RepID=A0ABT7ZCK6_9ACTN|nr:alkaline phosphatase D family protein [Streptomyces ficellus]MDN3297175.1 alkaline phosphatase D family protein [Streptomyces ficellus]
MAAGLRLGPLLRYVDWDRGDRATVWVETDGPRTAEVRCADGAGGSVRTFQVAGHHYALIPVTGLTPGSTTSYEVLLDGHRVWPPADWQYPASTITTPGPDTTGVRVTFGSCRWAAPPAGGEDPVGPDALDTLASRLAADPGPGHVRSDPVRPDVLLLLGDQVYADETSEATRQWLAGRRDLNEEPGAQVADYEEYTHLYYESWLDPGVRWLLSTVPTCMIFDDHDVIDDWNTSAAWVADMRRTDWWRERILSGLMSYWVHQHLGNLSPDELDADPLYAAVRAADDGTEPLRRYAAEAEADPARVRWSYRRDFGRTRLLMVDTRAARVLDEQKRAMHDEDEAQWLEEQALEGLSGRDHLLVGTSLPWLLPPLMHGAETWNAALCRGERGPRWGRLSERLRRGADLEHWSAFPESFERLTRLLARAGEGPQAPATVCVMSGDVHHAYVAEPAWPAGEEPGARVVQLTCSPVHNGIPLVLRVAFRLGWSPVGRWLGRVLLRHGRAGRPRVDWRRTGGPWFGNQLMTLTLRGRSAELRLEQAREGAGLVTVQTRSLTPSSEPGARNRSEQ